MRFASLPLFFAAALSLASCNSQPAREGTSVAASAAATGEPAKAPSPAPAPLPASAPTDLDVAALKKKLACVGDTRRQACRILNEFGEASRFAPQIPSGEGRWIGTAHTIEKGVEKSELMIVSASQVPTSTVAPGELALKVGIGPLPDDKRDHGIKLVNALSHGDTVSKNNQAAPYVKSWKPGDAQATMTTSDVSIRRVADETYLRQTSVKMLLVRLKAQAAGSAAEATLAELWPAAW